MDPARHARPALPDQRRDEFRASATRSKVFEAAFGADDYLELQPSSIGPWPCAPAEVRRIYKSSMARQVERVHHAPDGSESRRGVLHGGLSRPDFGYSWKTSDFPWMGIWEENLSRTEAPWNSNTIARGMEFGVSPMPETRRQMIDRGRLFGVPTYRWLPARTRLTVEYHATCSSPAETQSR